MAPGRTDHSGPGQSRPRSDKPLGLLQLLVLLRVSNCDDGEFRKSLQGILCVLIESVRLLAFQAEDADHPVLIEERRGHLGFYARIEIDIVGVITDITDKLRTSGLHRPPGDADSSGAEEPPLSHPF